MSGKSDIVKGRFKEAAGALTGNEKLREEGRSNQAVGKSRQVVEKVAKNVENEIKKIAKDTSN